MQGLITLKSRHEQHLMREAGKVVAGCHEALRSFIRPGIRTIEIDQFVEDFIRRHRMEPAQKGYRGYPFASCTSVNDVICHGFPGEYVLQEGDIVTVDMVAVYKGLHADSAWSYAVGEVSETARRLLDVTRRALYIGIEQAIPGNHISDIGHAIQTYVEAQGFSVVRDYIGHGIGRQMHESPEVLHFGPPHRGPKIRKGMAFTVEPMVNVGTYETKLDPDGWTARTADGSLSAQYEHTLIITDNGPEIITKQDGE
ncbi:type I methionyl aminopeptidase [Alicyclobacillus acidocaldarius]|uniref:Methionine aminopeptidase n=1 Tax=Alicyclobacillus acidocaldarius (strain Tc-4-1) TaxID=1048834 RepID=F8ICG1_ALIAT|nr:type I methionyl aminopeptidase [Alicyclobacillus acidocaldarius]AEJ42437.1 methionine aminopeptidase, type I [Alicyclobacillus acidocaldarius subsp. acidocaldarius Tc-4-1]